MTVLENVISTLAKLKKAPSDIWFIGSVPTGHVCTWEEFKQLADITLRTHECVASDLVIIFNDGLTISCNNMSVQPDYLNAEVVTMLTPEHPHRITSIVVDYNWNTTTFLLELNPVKKTA